MSKTLTMAVPCGAPVGALASADRLGSDPSLSVGRPGQHREDRLVGREPRGLDRVAGGEDVRHRRAHLGVDGDATERSDRHAGLAGQLDARLHADGKHDDVDDHARSVGEPDDERAGVVLVDRRGGGAESDVDTVGRDVEVEDAGHLGIEPRHQTVGALHHRRREARVRSASVISRPM